jgi:uncharacterized protein YceH (UPF0502 family)
MADPVKIDPTEARVLGVLIEKALTTPEQYPLTINAVVNGANQKSNRNPVTSLEEEKVYDILEELIDRELVRRVWPGNSRVDKYIHTATERLQLGVAQVAVLAELLLRGPQTVGELRGRAQRMVPLDSIDATHAILGQLIEREIVRRLPPPPGSRAELYAQLLSPDSHPISQAEARVSRPPAAPAEPATRSSDPALAERVATLERTVDMLGAKLRKLAQDLGTSLDD